MVTIFTIPKPFKGHIAIIQRNAIQSWTKLCPVPEIILFGDDEGIAEAAMEFGVKHFPGIKKNEYGTPLLDFVFEKAEALASHETLCYVNTDIILMDDLLTAFKKIRFKHFLVAGQRWDVELEGPLNFRDHGWKNELLRDVAIRGSLHPPSGSDYFLFPKKVLGTLPPFAVGRAGWDNWLIYHAWKKGMPVIDASQSVKVVHQAHGYDHVVGGKGTVEGPETSENLVLIKESPKVFTLKDADWRTTPNGLKRAKRTEERFKSFLKRWHQKLFT